MRSALISVALACMATSELTAQTPARTARVEVGGTSIIIRYRDARIARLSPRAEELVRDAWPRMVKIFGGPPLTLARAPYDSVVIDLSYGLGEGRSDPQHIALQMNPDTLAFGYSTWEIAVLHELFHFWNANTFRGASGNEQWFTEGVTEYYALRLARELGIFSLDELAAKLAMVVGYYANDAGIGTLSLASAGTGGYRAKHYFLVYAGGATAAMVLDFDIRLATKGAHTFDDILRALYRKYDATTNLFTNASVRAELEGMTQKSYQDFFARFVDGKEIIPVGRYLSLTDLYFLNFPPRFDANSDRGRVLRAMFGVP